MTVHEYEAHVVRVIDADTLSLDVDLGYRIWLRALPFRLVGINARELREPGGKEARDNLAALLPAGTPVVLSSVKNDKFGGRYDALVRLLDGRDLAQVLIAGGWAAAWDGDGVKPVPGWPRVERAG